MSGLQALLKPRSIAVVGASDQPGRGRTVLDNLRLGGFDKRIIPVNPKYESVSDLPCVPDLSSLPHPVDLLAFAIPAGLVAPALKRIPRGVAASAIILSAGFGEAGQPGKELEANLISIAQQKRIRICGPNCLGLINVHAGTAAYSASLRRMPPAGGIGVVAQSGTLCIGMMNARADLAFSYIISTGNEADLTSDEYIYFLADDPRTDCIALFLEGVRNPQGFLNALDHAKDRGKPIVVLKAGRSETGRRATLAHTGALSGSERVFKGLFAQKGVIQVSDMDEQLATLGLLSQGRLPAGRGLAVTTVSGAQSALVCDAAEDMGLNLPEWSPNISKRLADVLPDFATVANPLDTTGAGVVQQGLYENSIRALIEDPAVHLLAALQDIPIGLGPSSKKSYKAICESLVRVAASTDKPVVLFTQFSGSTDPDLQEILLEGNVPLLQGMIPSLRAIRNVIGFAERMRQDRPSPATPTGEADATVISRLRETDGPLGERKSKEILARCGLPVTREDSAQSEADCVQLAESLGFPVVVKVDSPDLPHKTEAGAVRIGLDSFESVQAAYRQILDCARRYRPDARISGVLVQEQVPAGVELIIGLGIDPQFGKIILAGMGGILAEVTEDVSVRLLPITRHDAEEMLNELRGSRILDGIRGRKRSDREAVIRALLALSEFGFLYGEWIEEVDINPLIVGVEGQGAKAVDALIVPRL